MRSWIGIFLFASLAIFTVILIGCSPKIKTSSTQSAVKQAADPWATAVKALTRSDDQTLPDIRRTLEALNSDLATNETAAAPAKLTPEKEKQLEALCPGFNADDWLELKSPTFTKLDSSYYIDCIYLRDAVRSLDLSDVPPIEKAPIIFDWVCRQVYIGQPLPNQRTLPPLPPAVVLKRGWGTPIERAMIALRSFQIAQLDACLLGLPGSESAGTITMSQVPNQPAKLNQPFWGVAVKIGDALIPFHLATGTAIRKANGNLAKLSELIAQPDLAKAWMTESFTAETLAKSIPVLAMPISAMAQRWAVLESKLESGVNLSIDPIALQKAFGPQSKFWNRPNEPFDLAHGFGTITPKADGGRETEAQGLLAIDKSMQVPMSIFALPTELQNQSVRQAIAARLASMYAEAFIESPSPKERIARGSFFDVTKDLVEKENRFSQSAQRYETQQSTVSEIRVLLVNLNEIYYAIESAKQKNDSSKLANATQELERINKESGRTMQLFIDGMIGKVSAAEATYLLALNKQEIAERAQKKAERADKAAIEAANVPMADPKKVAVIRATADKIMQQAVESWAGARDWWDRYDRYREFHGQLFPGRAPQAKALAEKARVSGR